MFERNLRRVVLLLMVSGFTASGSLLARDDGHTPKVESGLSQQVDGINIYYGLLPAEIASKHPPTHEEKTMHGGVPERKGDYHLIVALFDQKGNRITNAHVTAAVGELGLSGTRKNLSPMRIGEGNTSYGNYFTLRGNGVYRISIQVHRLAEGKSNSVEALFDYRLQ
jgi:hypothetical protein